MQVILFMKLQIMFGNNNIRDMLGNFDVILSIRVLECFFFLHINRIEVLPQFVFETLDTKKQNSTRF